MTVRHETLPALLRHHDHVRPGSIALEEGGIALSFGALRKAVDGVAAGLRAAGVGPADRVAFIGRNSLAYFELLFAAAAIGAVIVPISWRLSVPEMEVILIDAAPRLIFAEEGLTVPGGKGFAIPLIISAGGDGLASWRAGYAPFEEDADPAPGSVVLQLYTSGTTGVPKGVMLTHANLLFQRQQDATSGLPWADWTERDVSLISMPIAHVSGTVWAFYSLYHGARGIILRDFVPEEVLDIFAREPVTKLFIVPAALRLLLEVMKARPRSPNALRYILYGGSPMPADVMADALALLDCELVQLYGMTECTGAATALSPDDHRSGDAGILASAGRPLPGVEIALRNLVTDAVQVRGIGEVLIRSSGVMAGYWRKPADSVAALHGAGWLRTGDVGEIDDTGLLAIRDRLKDMIITGGENVYSGEVERVLLNFPSVSEVAVVGFPDPRWGESIRAFVVPAAGKDFDPLALTDWAKERMAHFKCPRDVVVVDALPRNPSGKVLKKRLRGDCPEL